MEAGLTKWFPKPEQIDLRLYKYAIDSSQTFPLPLGGEGQGEGVFFLIKVVIQQ
jgi:hypothetical protein